MPIPPSKAKDHALYDDRMVRMLRQMKFAKAADIRELLWQNGTRALAVHDGDRPGPDELEQLFRIARLLPHRARNASRCSMMCW